MNADDPMTRRGELRRGLRGRDAEIERLRRLLGGLAGGSADHLLIVGEPGSGKSALLDHARAEALDASIPVALVRPGGIASSGVAATIAQALAEPGIGVIDASAAHQMETSPELRYWWLQEIEAAIERLSQPLLIVIDDLQFADELTRLAARVLPRRMARSSVGWIVAQRTADFDQEAMRTASGSMKARNPILLGRLDTEAVARIATDVLGGAPDDAIRSVLARAEGLPLRVISSALEMKDAGAAQVSNGTVSLVRSRLDARDREMDPIERRLENLDPSARKIALSVSVLGLQFTVEDIMLLTGLAPGQLLEPVAKLLRSGVLRDAGGALEFEHEIVRQTAEGQLEPENRNRLSKAAFDMSREANDTSPVLAKRALRAVEQTGSKAAGAPTLAEALEILETALTAVAEEDAQLAADIVERRLQLLDQTGSQLRGAMAEAIPFLLHAGRTSEARELAQRGIAVGMDPDEEVAARLALAQLTTMDQPTATRENLQAALRLPVRSPVLRGRLAAMSTRPYTTDYLYDALEEVLPEVREIVRLSNDDIALATLEHVEAIAAYFRHDWAYARQVTSRAEERSARTESPEGWFATLIRISLLRYSGRPLDALHSVDREIRTADERQQAFALVHLQLVRANVLLDLGRLDEAEIQAEAVRDLGEDIGAVWPIDVGAVSILAQIAIYKDSPGVVERLESVVREFERDEVAHQRRGGEWIQLLFADIRGETRTLDARTSGTYERSRIYGPPVGGASDTFDDVYFARITLAIGHPERAKKAASIARDRAAGAKVPIAKAVFEHVTGLIDGSPPLLRSAAEAYRRIGRPLAEAAAWEDLAVCVAPQDRVEATEALLTAHTLLAACEATRSLARVEGRLRALGERPPVRASPRNALGLTAAEQRIVDRAARNETAAEIAVALYLSRNTVTAHLRRIYAKLGVRSRQQMIEVVRTGGVGGV